MMTSFLRGLCILAAWLCAAVVGVVEARPQGEAITGVTYYADPQAQPVGNAVVLLRDGLIQAAGPASRTPIPRDYRIVSLKGKTLVAGFWNSHVHLTTPELLGAERAPAAALSASLEQMFVRWGFTSVFDLASTTTGATALRGRIETGEVTGPAILTVGEPFYPAGGTPIYARPIFKQFNLPSAEITSIEQAISRLDAQARGGVDGIKLFTGAIVGGEEGVMIMPVDQVRAIAGEARRLGLPVFAHPTNEAGLMAAIGGGVDVLAHAAPLSGAWSDDLARQIAGKQVALVPTLSLFEANPDPSTPVSIAVQQTRALAAQGGEILFGTDAGFADTYDTSAELRLMSQALSWRQVFASLTTAPASRFGQGAVRGKIVKGMRADLVALDADPASDVTAFSKVAMVWRDGTLIYGNTGIEEQ